jgi:hypothetical protein
VTTNERRELEFDTVKFMTDIRAGFRQRTDSVLPIDGLRNIADFVGTSASTLSRIDNGETPNMETFMAICAKLELVPGDYFSWVTWVRKVE